MTDTDTTTFNVLLEMLREITENLKKFRELEKLDEINKQLNDIIKLLNKEKESFYVLCKQFTLERLSKYFNTTLQAPLNDISSYTDNLSRILYADNSVGVEEQLKYIKATVYSTRDIRKILLLIEGVKESLDKLSDILNDLEKCGVTVNILRNNIETVRDNLSYKLKQINRFTGRGQYSIDQLAGWIRDLAKELLIAVYGISGLNQDSLFEKFSRFATYLVGYATIVRYYTFNSAVVGLKPNEIIDLIDQLNIYLFDNIDALLLDSINNINIDVHIKENIKKELKRIFSKTRYSPLINNEVVQIINDPSLSKYRNLLEKIIEGFVLGDRSHIKSNNRLLSIFNDLEQVILRLIVIIILLNNIKIDLKELYDYVNKNYFYYF